MLNINTITITFSLFLYFLFNINFVNSYELDYNVELSQRYVEFSGIAYCADPIVTSNSVDNWNCKFCKNYPNVNATSFYGGAITDAKGFVAYDYDANEIIVSFSGTDPISLRNWIDDIDIIQVDYPYCSDTNCKVHQGFYNTFNSVKDQVITSVEYYKQQHSDANIAVTGHSLGASLAVLCVAELTYLGYNIDSSYNYGQPRSGNEAFEMWYKETVTGTYRLTHHKDPVPHMVPMATGFHHMPYEVCVYVYMCVCVYIYCVFCWCMHM